MELERAEQLWQAMGFAHVDDDEVVFTDADIAALKALVQLVSAEVIQTELENAVARSLAQSMSRLAEWQVGIFRALLGKQFAEDLDTTAQFAGAILPVTERLQEYVWRRHLAATATRALAEPETNPNEVVQAVGFADIVGYTRLIRDFTELELARLIDRFEELVNRVIAENHGGSSNGRRRSAVRDRPRGGSRRDRPDPQRGDRQDRGHAAAADRDGMGTVWPGSGTCTGPRSTSPAG